MFFTLGLKLEQTVIVFLIPEREMLFKLKAFFASTLLSIPETLIELTGEPLGTTTEFLIPATFKLLAITGELAGKYIPTTLARLPFALIVI